MTILKCSCERVSLELRGEPILCSECHCNSCRTAADFIQKLPSSVQFRSSNGGTPYVLYRKDRVRCSAGEELLKEIYLSEKSSSRRVVATCCRSPLFLEFKGGHWLSLYASLWPEATRPKMDVRTMTSDLPDKSHLPNDIPNARTQSISFMLKLLRAWIAMGFRTSKAPTAAGGRLNIS